MVITCGNCGQKIEIDAATPDGTHVLCPYCNVKTTFSRPSRVELPVGLGASSSRRPRPQTPPAPQTPPSAPTSPSAPTPPPGADYEADLRARRVAEIEGRVQNAEQRKARAAARDQKQAQRREIVLFSKIAILLAVLGLTAFASWWFWNHQKEKQERARQAAALVEQLRAEEEKRVAAERAERERQRKAEAEEQKKKDEARRAEDERRRAEDEAKRAETEARRKLFAATEEAFDGGAFHFISGLSKKKAPGACEGTFYYVLPRSEKARPSFVVCESSTNGTVACHRLFESGEKEPYEAADGFLKAVDGMDYLMLAPDKNLYFHSRRRKDHVGEISKETSEDVVAAFFGDIAKDVTRLVPEFDEIRFEIVFVPKSEGQKKASPIVVETLDYGLRYSLAKVRDAIEDAFPDTASAAKAKRKRSKRTVVFWDGSVVKKGIDGVTYVPRTCPATTRTYRSRNGYTSYSSTSDRSSQWHSLYNEALRQEEREREAERNEAAERAQKGADAYRRRLDRIFEDGTLFFRARVKNR